MCAIAGICNHPEAANLTYLSLAALQHRGSEGAGIVSKDSAYHTIRRCGLVNDIFNADNLAELKGNSAIGHTRYSTTGSSIESNLQPFVLRTNVGTLAISHNGNLTNADTLIKKLETRGSIFQSTSDTEIIIHLIARLQLPLLEALPKALNMVEGAYSLLILAQEIMIAVRDPYGFRPLVMGEIAGNLVFASETCAFDLIGASYIREVQPGEMIVVDLENNSYKSSFPLETKCKKRCIFEHVYFARPDSLIFGADVYSVRKALGMQLAIEQPAKAELVVPVPDSGVPAAIGYAEQSKIPFEMGLIRAHFSLRTFIEPKQSIRDFGVKLKLNPLKSLKGKDIVVVDDSLVRGTTSKKIINMLRNVGVNKVHFRISAPPITHPCVYGIDTPTKEELLASHLDQKGVCDYIGADSIGYLSLEGMMEVGSRFSGEGYCNACWTGAYPTNLGKKK